MTFVSERLPALNLSPRFQFRPQGVDEVGLGGVRNGVLQFVRVVEQVVKFHGGAVMAAFYFGGGMGSEAAERTQDSP